MFRPLDENKDLPLLSLAISSLMHFPGFAAFSHSSKILLSSTDTLLIVDVFFLTSSSLHSQVGMDKVVG